MVVFQVSADSLWWSSCWNFPDTEEGVKLRLKEKLQDDKIWKKFLGKDIIPKNNSCEFYFEEQNMEAFIEKLETLYPSIQYVNRLMVHSWGQKVIRFYDLDGNLIEVGTPM